MSKQQQASTIKASVPPEEVQTPEEEDDYDKIDEMFLALNNALEEKETELKEREEAIKKKEEELEEKEADLEEKEDENMELRRENSRLNLRFQVFPAIFSEVPQEAYMNQSYPIIQKLNDLNLTAVYMAARKILIQILKKLRELSDMTTNIEVNWTCAAGFYRVQFPAVTLHDIIDSLKDFIKELKEIHNEDLNKLLTELESKVIDKLEET